MNYTDAKQAVDPIGEEFLNTLLGDSKDARAEATEVERMVAHPDSAVGYSALSDVLNSTGRPAEALAAANKAEQLDSHFDVYLLEQGLAYTEMGRWQEAATAFERFHASHPDDFWSHVFLAIDYVELGNNDAARAEVTQLLSLNPRFSPKTITTTDIAKRERFEADLRKAGLK